MRNVEKIGHDKYKDHDTNRTMTRNQFVKKIKNPNSVYSDHYHIRKISNTNIPASNPDNKSKNNLVR